MTRKFRFGMVGGGRDAFIGVVHRMAATLDGRAELVAGAFSSQPDVSQASGRDLLLDPHRVYGSYTDMAAAEAARPAAERLDFVVVVTPNHQHFPMVKTFLEHGFHVVCDKPLALSVAEAVELRETVRRTQRLFALTHNYTGYPMVKEARALVASGALGDIRKVVVEYTQGWLATSLEAGGHKQADWRTDPARSGPAGSIGDIGTHAENLVRYVSGLKIESLCADLTSFVPGRRLDDDANILVRYQGGAKGVLHVSQIAVGEENRFELRLYGTKASLEWRQECPTELIVRSADAPLTIRTAGRSYNRHVARTPTRVPSGHPEGFIEAFANLYLEFFRALEAAAAGEAFVADHPGIDDGVAGLAFVETVVASARAGARWTPLVTPGGRSAP